MFTKAPLRIAKWHLVQAALWQQVAAKDNIAMYFGKVVEMRERAERELTPRPQDSRMGQKQDILVGDEKSR